MHDKSHIKQIKINNKKINFKHLKQLHNFEKHFHEDSYMIGTPICGYNIFKIHSKTYKANSNTVCIIPPRLVHKCKSFSKNNSYKFVNFFPSEDLLLDILKSYNSNLDTIQLPYFIQDLELAQYLKEGIFEALSNDKIDKIIIFLTQLIQKYAKFDKSIHPKYDKKFLKLFDYLKNEKYDLEELDFYFLAKVMKMNPYYFHRTFSKTFDITPQNFINQLKVEKATRSLNKKSNITMIALENGFYDQAHFTKQFKKFHGVTPRNYFEF